MLKKISYLLVLISFFAVSCQKNIVKVISKSFEKEVPTTGNLHFIFDKAVAPDSIIDFWDTTAYIKFQPAIDGRFKWTSASELVFSPFNELPPSTSFNAEITKNICKYSKFRLGGETKFEFHTPELLIETSHAYWTVFNEDISNVGVSLQLQFNYDVDPNIIAKNIEILVDGTKQSFNVITGEAGRTCEFALLNVKKVDKDSKVDIVVKKGITIYKSSSLTTKDISSNCILISPYNLQINSVNQEHDGIEGRIQIYTSQQVKEAELASFITIEPKVQFKFEVENDHVLIYSDELTPNQIYTLKLRKGLMGIIGGKLKDDYETQISFGELEPTISINDNKSFYLSGKGLKNIGVNIINVQKVKVTISKIYENNLLRANNYRPNTNGYEYEDGEYYEDNYDGYDYYYDEYTEGDIIWEKTYDTKTLAKLGNLRLLNINFSDKLPEHKGVYHIQISSDEDRWLRDSRVISISDIGIVAKQGKEKMYVFTHSISEAKPLGGVSISIIGANNQVVGQGVSGSDGSAEIKYTNNMIKGFKPSLITAKLNTDFTYLPFNRTHVNTSRFDVGGVTTNTSGLQCFIYPERDMYRPGEKVNAAVVLRNQNWTLPGSIPVKVKVFLPNGNEHKLLKKSVNEQGSFDISFDVPTSGVTGSYSLAVYTTNDIFLGSKYIRIEEFLPDRIKVVATPDKKILQAGESLTMNINAQNYFGPPASNNAYEVEFKLEKANFTAPKYPSYNFSMFDNGTYFSSDVRNTKKTDEKGNAKEVYKIPSEYANMGKLILHVFTSVFDENSRPVNRSNDIEVFTQNTFYGIGTFSYWNSLNSAITIPLIAVNKNGDAISDKAKIQIIRFEYKTVLESSGSYYSYRSEKEERVVETREISLSGTNSSYSFIPRNSGTYQVRIYKPGTNAYVAETFYAYGYGNNYNSSFEVNNEGNVDISLDKKKYQIGETANVLFKTPFVGKLIITIEANEVLNHYTIETDKKTASLPIKIENQYLPNVYISATLIKAHTVSDMPLTVAHGIIPLLVENKDAKMNVSITAAKSVRSKTKQTIQVKAAPNSYLTIAAVDEGILAMTGYKTPDPYGYFYAKRALGIRSFDMYPYLFQELRRSSSGGDGYDLSKRVNPLTNKRVKLVSFWSGLIKTDGNGNANLPIEIPQFSGQLRIMAVAHKDNIFGSAESFMTVADPIVISSGLPRFFSPGDTIEMPVTISNTTSKSVSANAIVSVSGPVKLAGTNTQNASISPNSDISMLFKLVAVQAIGNAKVNVTVNNGSEKYIDETEVTVRPSASLQKNTSNGTIQGGTTQTISLNTKDFIASSVGGSILIGKSPIIQFASSLDYLVSYPYGCMEQTISTAFPQLYFSDMCIAMYKTPSKNMNPNANIEEALKKIKLCQIYNGGLTMWSGGGDVNWWATTYAAHFMLEAKRAGFEIDEACLDKMLGYIRMRLKNKETITYYYNRTENKKTAPKEVAYSLYVLSLAGKPENSIMSYYKSNIALLTTDARYMLSAAYYISGDKSMYKEILPGQFGNETSVRQNDGSFYSSIRDKGVALNALLEINPNDPQVAVISKLLSTELKGSYYCNTQEQAWALLGLGKIAKKTNTQQVSADILSGGKIIGTYKDGMMTFRKEQMTNNQITIQVKNGGNLYYFVNSEGISASGSYKEEDAFLQVRKTFFDRFGRQITGNTFNQNDIVVIRIALKTSGNYIDNIVVSDMLPAGFEIENPRIKDVPGTSWIKDDSNPLHFDIRDDRINLFVGASSNTQYYYYAVRCVTKGTFKMGPVSADAMYNGEFHSYHGAGWVKIK